MDETDDFQTADLPSTTLLAIVMPHGTLILKRYSYMSFITRSHKDLKGILTLPVDTMYIVQRYSH